MNKTINVSEPETPMPSGTPMNPMTCTKMFVKIRLPTMNRTVSHKKSLLGTVSVSVILLTFLLPLVILAVSVIKWGVKM